MLNIYSDKQKALDEAFQRFTQKQKLILALRLPYAS